MTSTSASKGVRDIERDLTLFIYFWHSRLYRPGFYKNQETLVGDLLPPPSSLIFSKLGKPFPELLLGTLFRHRSRGLSRSKRADRKTEDIASDILLSFLKGLF